MKSLAVVLCASLLLGGLGAQSVWQQTLPNGFGDTMGSVPSLSPFSDPSPSRWHWHYDFQQFLARGRIQINEMWVRPHDLSRSRTSAQRTSVDVYLATATTAYGAAARAPGFDQNVARRELVRAGTWTIPASQAPLVPRRAWMRLGLQTPFTYDPTQGEDLIIELRVCSSGSLPSLPPLDTALGVAGTLGGNAYGAIGNCLAQTPTRLGSEEVPIVRIDFEALDGFLFEPNDDHAAASIDGLVSNPYQPAISRRCINDLADFELSSQLVGSGFELAVIAAPLVGRTQGAAITQGGQLLNLPIASPFLRFVFGGLTPRLDLQTIGPAPLRFSLPVAGAVLSMQMAVIDPSAADGFALSRASQLEGSPPTGPQTLVLGDDDFARIRFGSPPFCGPADFAFYGTSYTECFVSSNGRLTFDSGYVANTMTPEVARTGPPMIGAWTDLDPTQGGSITVSSPQSGVCDVIWDQIPAAGGGPGNSATVRLLGPTNEAEINWSGFGGAGRPANQNYFLGLSPGYLGPATNPGQRSFLISGGVAQPSDMLYMYGTLQAGLFTFLNGVRFSPDGNNNYRFQTF